MSNHTYVIIMAGGVGSRFWPASRTARPKQFLDILGTGHSLLRLTFERFLKLCPAERVFVVTNALYKDLVKEQLPELSDNQVLCEPSRNNTAPCVAYAALKIHSLDSQANLVIAPSDHVILQEEAFVQTLSKALAFAASQDALLTLGIKPSRPDTGYGYIHYDREAPNGVHRVLRFTEKPPLEQAQAFMASGDYLWNAGIFVWRATTILAAFQKHAAGIYDILSEDINSYNTSTEQAFINRRYPATPDISIDYAIMEKADNVFTIPSDFGWSDLGTWASLHGELAKDDDGNAIVGGRTMAYDTHNCLVHLPEGKLAVLRGLEDFIIVDEGDVLLIYPKSKEQDIKKVTQALQQQGESDFL